MSDPQKRRRLGAREIRLFCLLGIVLVFAAWKFIPRPWSPAVNLRTAHYEIRSSASREQTVEMAQAVEELYRVFSNRFSMLPHFQPPAKPLEMKLYRDRKEFRSINPGLGWAEAFYRSPYCQAYYSAEENNPHHWMLHEAVHQLTAEVAHIKAEKWLSEGIAEYFGTSRIIKGQLKPGSIDPNTYPVWWLDELATTPHLNTNVANGSVIPLRAIVSGRGGPSINKNFNLYYLHWWSLTHFVFETEPYRQRASELFAQGGELPVFEKLIGPVEKIEAEWHAHVRRIKAAVAGHDAVFLRTGRLPPPPP